MIQANIEGQDRSVYMPPDVLAKSGVLDQEEVALFYQMAKELCDHLISQYEKKLHFPARKLIENVLIRSCDCGSCGRED